MRDVLGTAASQAIESNPEIHLLFQKKVKFGNFANAKRMKVRFFPSANPGGANSKSSSSVTASALLTHLFIWHYHDR